ncbi:MAG: Gfo/Idh/MocA family protein [Pseudomonadota bacterium]
MPAATTTPDQQRRRLRVGLVGAGRHAREVIAPALTLAGIEIAGVAARGTSSAANLAELLGNVPAFAGAPAMIASLRGEIDAIVAVLPAGQGEVAISPALEAGLAVYCEKPGALAADELRKLELARAERQGKVMIGYMKRFAPAYRRARDLACEADFGGISALSLQWSMGSLYADADYFLRENAVHMFDLIRFLIGEVTEVHAIRDRSGAGIAIAQALRLVVSVNVV